MTMAGATLVILVVGSGAGFIPARRASRIDPAAALRQE
jgi:ABC-type antimicrobial peptide transport system permease subunit